MKGYEILRELAGDMYGNVKTYDVVPHIYCPGPLMDIVDGNPLLRDAIREIADRIEREQDDLVDDGIELYYLIKNEGGADSIEQKAVFADVILKKLLGDDYKASHDLSLYERVRLQDMATDAIDELNLMKRWAAASISNITEDDALDIPASELIEALEGRIMPDGMEWLVDAWRVLQLDGHEPKDCGRFTVLCRDMDAEEDCRCDPSLLTHERPDSWERLEEDAEKSACKYFDQSDGCGSCPHYPSECGIDKTRDLVRRAKALAERGK